MTDRNTPRFGALARELGEEAAALLHASRNAVVKSSPDKFLDIVVVTSGTAALSAPVFPFFPLPWSSSWPYLAASVVIHVAYFLLIGGLLPQRR